MYDSATNCLPPPKPQAQNRVYRYDPGSGLVTAVVSNFVEPNGLCFSPDESKLYIADSYNQRIRVVNL